MGGVVFAKVRERLTWEGQRGEVPQSLPFWEGDVLDWSIFKLEPEIRIRITIIHDADLCFL
jgi:hypothetical protein